MHLGLTEADQTFLRWVLRGQRSWLIRRHCPSRIPWCKPTRILSPALDSPTRGLLTGLGYKSLVGVAPVQDPAFCREARPCQRRELPSEGKGTTAAPPAVTSKCSCTGCRRRTTIRSRPRKKSSLRSSVGTGSSVQISTSAGRHGSSKASAASARRSRPPPRKKFGWRSTGTATRPTAFGLSKASARTRRPARCSVGSSSSRPPASSAPRATRSGSNYDGPPVTDRVIQLVTLGSPTVFDSRTDGEARSFRPRPVAHRDAYDDSNELATEDNCPRSAMVGWAAQ